MLVTQVGRHELRWLACSGSMSSGHEREMIAASGSHRPRLQETAPARNGCDRARIAAWLKDAPACEMPLRHRVVAPVSRAAFEVRSHGCRQAKLGGKPTAVRPERGHVTLSTVRRIKGLPHTALRARGDGELHTLEAVLKLLGIDWSAWETASTEDLEVWTHSGEWCRDESG